MKRLIFPLLVAIATCFTACQKCGTVDSFEMAQEGHLLKISWTGSDADGLNGIEISYGDADSDHKPKQGQFINLPADGLQYINWNDEGISLGNRYNFYLRAACNGDKYSRWEGPVSVTIADYCPVPSDIRFTGIPGEITVRWDPNTWPVENSFYKLELTEQGSNDWLDAQGFNRNNPDCRDMVMREGVVYRFRVRAWCDALQDWSAWSDEKVYLCEADQNV